MYKIAYFVFIFNIRRFHNIMKISPLKGTKDFLPSETALRDYVQNSILSVYKKSGFVRISTPIIEDMENLDKSDGGDNLNLIFKILKRGEKLEKALKAENTSENAIADMGLRYDLTLPLSRYFAANKEKLPTPFKVIQTDRVYRAERPQKGRMREFVQCDIDIIGDSSANAETELIDVTARALLGIGFNDLTILINDRRMLKSMLLNFGFEDSTIDSVCITYDKLDKIGVQGVKDELLQKEMPFNAIERLCEFLAQGDFSLEKVSELLSDNDAETAASLKEIINNINVISQNKYKIEFSPRLVRGQGYYTGVVFEVTSPGFAGAIGGGGRYDNMVGKFLNTEIPAVGFSIGFERIINILLENGFEVPSTSKNIALLYKSSENFADVLQKAAELRETYNVNILKAAKKVGKQIDKLASEGYSGVCFFEKYPEIKIIT